MVNPSPNDSVVVSPGSTLFDAAGNAWWISNGAQVVKAQVAADGVTLTNVTTDPTTANVDALAIVNGSIWQQAQPPSGLWWQSTGSGWGSATAQSPLPPSPDGTVIQAGNNSVLVDPSGNLWWIANGQVVENGAPDTGTSNVTEMALKDGVIYQQGTGGEWWAKTGQGFDGWGTPGNADGSVPPPVGEVRTWLGGIDQNANTAANWSPTGVPQPGDVLTMNGGLMNISGNDLTGDTLNIETNNTVNPAAVTLNLSNGAVPMTLDSGQGDAGAVTVNLADNTDWIGGANAGPFGGPVTIQATGPQATGTWSNTTSLIDNSVLVSANVVGNGSFTTEMAHGTGTKLEFAQGVSAGQTVTITGGQYPANGISTVQVDDPSNYHASTTLGFGEMILQGVTADSYTYQNDMLSLYNGSTVVDTLNLALQTSNNGLAAATNFGVSQVGGSVVLHADGASYQGGGTLLPVHV